jgi:GNAT superfamily N-acetyltransferase
MEQAVRAWYSSLCAEDDLQKIGAEPEETGDLIHEDFRFEMVVTAVGAEIRARNADDVPAGIVVLREDGDRILVERLFVEEAFRGLGLGTALVHKMLEANAGRRIVIDLPAECDAFARVLLRESFTPVLTRFARSG